MTNIIRTFLICLALAFGLQAQTQYFDSHLNTEGAVNYCGSDTGSGNAYICANVAGAKISSYQTGKTYTFRATHTNSGASTLAIDGLSTVAIKKQQGVSDLASVDITSGATVSVLYDGTFFEMVSLPGNPVGAINLAPNTFTVWNVGGGLTFYTLQAPAASGSGLTGLTGDGLATGFGTVPLTLPSVNSTPGTFGDSSHCITNLVVTPKGLITGIAQSTGCPGAGGAGGTVTTFSAPTGGFPSWFVPNVTNPTSTPLLSVSVTSQGNGGKVQLSTGTTVTNDCVKFDANGNTVDSGSSCGAGGGGTGWTVGPLSGLPGTCTTGAAYFATDNPASQELYLCTATNVYTQFFSLGGSGALQFTGGVLDVNASVVALINNAINWGAVQTFAHGLTLAAGLYSALPTPVQGMTDFITDGNTNTLGSAVTGGGTNKVAILYNGTAWVVTGNGTASGTSSFYQTFLHDGTTVTQRTKFNLAAGSNMTITATDNGTDTTTFTLASTGGGGGSGWTTGLLSALPGTCTVGGAYFATDNPTGLELYLCTATNTWTQDKSIGGSGGLLYTAGVLDINPATMPFLGNTNSFTALQSMAAGFKIAPVAISALPACTVQGTFRTVNDALSPVAGTTISGGGSAFRPVVCDSTWKSLY